MLFLRSESVLFDAKKTGLDQNVFTAIFWKLSNTDPRLERPFYFRSISDDETLQSNFSFPALFIILLITLRVSTKIFVQPDWTKEA